MGRGRSGSPRRSCSRSRRDGSRRRSRGASCERGEREESRESHQSAVGSGEKKSGGRRRRRMWDVDDAGRSDVPKKAPSTDDMILHLQQQALLTKR